jgi:hypothetical protein
MKNVEDPLDACVAKAKSARTRSTARHVTAESEEKEELIQNCLF